MMLARILRTLVRRGRLTLIDAHGRIHRFGDGQGTAATFRLHDASLHRKLALNPRLYLGEAYIRAVQFSLGDPVR